MRRSRLEDHPRGADGELIALVERSLCGNPVAVDIGPIRRAEVGDRRGTATKTHHRVAAGDETIAIEHGSRMRVAAEQHLGLVQHDGSTNRQDVALNHNEATRRCRLRGRDGGWLRIKAMARAQDHALGRAADIANCRPRDPPDEQIEQDQHSNTEQEECLINHRSAVPLLDSQRAHPTRDLVSGTNRGAANAAPIDHRAVGRIEITQDEAFLAAAELGVAS